MPLGAREVLVAIRARDVSSRVLREIGNNFGHLSGSARQAAVSMQNTGASLTAVGVGMAGVGAIGLKFFNDSVDSFIEYSRQAAYTKTQVDDLTVSVADIAKVGKEVASKIPAPFNEMQDALYDIFSSMDVNLMEAQGLLEAFAKGAVAGQTDIRTAARATISIMNAYRLPFKDVNRVMDVMFRLVQKGVGTYEEFNHAIGRAIPAAVSAGQSIETLAGMMAFLTKNGLSTEMAATSAARALELFSKPDKFKALEDLGITVRDASGNFLQMNDIITQLASNQGWAEMSEPKRKEMFEEIFGTGTIQARRFFDIAIPNFDTLNSLTSTMQGSAGALEGAYDTMFGEPATQAQLLKNRVEVLRVEIGEQLVPAKLRLMEVALGLLDRWNSLDKGTQNIIIRIAAASAAFFTLAGAIITVIGVTMMLLGTMAMITGTIASAAVALGLILAIFAAIAAGVVAAIAAFRDFGGGLRGAGAAVLAFIAVAGGLSAIFLVIAAVATGAFIGVGTVVLGVAAVIAGAALLIWKNWDTVNGAIQSVWQSIQSFWDDLLGRVKGLIDWFGELHAASKVLFGIIAAPFLAIIAPIAAVVAAVVWVVKNFSTLVQWTKNVGNWIVIAASAIEDFSAAALDFLSPIGAIATEVFGTMIDVLVGAFHALQDFFNWITNVDLDVWGGIADAGVAVWHAIHSAVTTAAGAVMRAIDAVGGAIASAASFISSVAGTIWDGIKAGYDWFVDNFGQNFIDIWETVSKEVSDVAEEFKETFGVLIGDIITFVGRADDGFTILWHAVQFAWDRIKPILVFFGAQIISKFGPLIAFLGGVLPRLWDAAVHIFQGAVDILVDILGMLVTTWKFIWNMISSQVITTFNIVKSIIETGIGIIISLWDNFGGVLLDTIKIIWDLVSEVFEAGFKLVSNFIQFFLNLIQGDWGEAWGNLVDMLGAVWDALFAILRAGVNTLILIVTGIIPALAGFAVDLVGLLFDLGVDIISALIDGLSSLLSNVFDFFIELGPQILGLLVDAGKLLFNVGKDLVLGLIDGLVAAVGAVFDWIVDTGEGLIQAFKNIFGISSPSTVMLGIGKDIIQGLLDGIVLIAKTLFNWFTQMPVRILDLLADAATWLFETGKDIISGIIRGAKNLWESFDKWIDERKGRVLSFFVDAPNWLFETGKKIISGLLRGAKNLWEAVGEWIGERKSKILSYFVNAGEWLIEKGRAVFNGLWNGAKAAWSALAGWITGADGGGGISGRLKGYFGGAINWLYSAGRDIINGLKKGIRNVVDNIRDWISDRVDDIVGAFKSFFGINSPSTVMAEVGRNFIQGFMNGITSQARNIPALISKIGMGAMDLMKYLGLDLFGGITSSISSAATGNLGIQQIAKMMAAEQGWTGAQWEALNQLVIHESGWNPNAQNPTSTAYGLFQFLNSTWASTGYRKTSDPVQQILAGFTYIKQRYGNPQNAWGFWNSHVPHWYAKGSWDVGSTGLAGLHKGEMVIPKTFASSLRDAMSSRGGGGSGASFNFYGDVTFGSDMGRATSDLDFWTRTQTSGV